MQTHHKIGNRSMPPTHACPIIAGVRYTSCTKTQKILQKNREIGKISLPDDLLIDKLSDGVQMAYPSWEQTSFTQRKALIENFISRIEKTPKALCQCYALEDNHKLPEALAQQKRALVLLKKHINYTEALLAESLALPGPTGESNTLSLVPRGVFLSICQHPDLVPLIVQTATALLTGNAVLIFSEKNPAILQFNLTELLLAAGIPEGVVSFLPGDQKTLVHLLKSPYLAGLAYSGDLASGQVLNKKWAARKGALGQFIFAQKETNFIKIASPHYSLKFLAEKTLTINTAAIGGNASLLELGKGSP